jgi:hypothetical protein
MAGIGESLARLFLIELGEANVYSPRRPGVGYAKDKKTQAVREAAGSRA